MFCKNCGTELNENAEFCSQCGSQTGNANTNKKTIITKKNNIIVAAMVVLVIIVTLICIKSNNINSSPEKVAVATIKSEYEVDIKTMMKCFPAFTIREISVDEGLSKDASRREVAKKVQEDYRYETPQKVEIIDTEIVAEYDIEEYTIFRELHDYMTDDDYNLITKVAKVNVQFTVDGNKDSIQVTCIKMKNKWYFLRN